MSKQYIGKHEINKVVDDGEYMIVNFKDHEPVRLKNELFEIVLSAKKNNEASVEDIVRHNLATKFVVEMADLGVDYLTARLVAQGIQTLSENLMEDAIGRTFDCKSSLQVKLEQIIDGVETL